MPPKELRPRHPCVGLALAAVVGIVAADWWSTAATSWLIASCGIAAVGVIVWPRTAGCWLAACLAFFALHAGRVHDAPARSLAAQFRAGPKVATVKGIVWTQPEKPTVWSGRVSAFFDVRCESIEVDGKVREMDALLNVAWSGALPEYGDRVLITGQASNLESVRNPGQFDFAGYRQRRGVFSELRARFPEDCRVESHGHGRMLVAFAIRARCWVQSQLRRDLADAPELSSLIESMVLGMRGETPDEVRALFQKTGTLHLFAVSGLNIAMLAAIALYALKPLGIRRRPAVIIVIPLLAAYALVTGLSASCVRAAIMGTFVLAAQLFDRRTVVCNSLAAAAVGILAWDSHQLFLPGFQFSFMLVFVIVLLAVRIQRGCERFGRPDPFLPRALWSLPIRGGVWCWRHFSAAVGVTLAAWLGSLAFTAGYFHLFSVSAIFANLLAVPIAFCVLLLGLCTVVCAGVWSHGALLCSNANWLAAKALLWVVRTFSEMPGGHVYVELPRISEPAACEIAVLDCGEGAAIHLRAGRRDWLLDCASARTCENVVLPYLRSRGVNRLDGLFLTHGDAQHVGGALTAIAELSPRALFESPVRDRSPTRRNLHGQLQLGSFGKSIIWRGDRIGLGGDATLRVLHPPAGLNRATADDKALVVRLESAGVRVLFTSDSGFSTEQWLLENESDLRSDILVKGWHSKDLSGTPDFLARVQPQAVICSAPEFGDSSTVLDAWAGGLAARGVAVFRQDRCGAVRIALRPGDFSLRAVGDGQTFRSRAR